MILNAVMQKLFLLVHETRVFMKISMRIVERNPSDS